MRRVYQITASAFVLLAATLGYYAVGLRYYTPLGPGPGFFPVWLCAALAVLALLLFARASADDDRTLPSEFFAPRAAYGRIITVVAGLFVVANVLPIVGFRLAMLAFYIALLTLLGRRHILETLALALVGSLGTFFIFVEYLSQPLPIGIFGI